MKKVAFMFVAALAISFASCGGNKTAAVEETVDSAEAVVEEVVDSAAAVVDSAAVVVDSAAVVAE